MEANYIGGIKKETYELLFKDENLPNLENIDTSANDKILDEIATFTKLNLNNLTETEKQTLNMYLSRISYDKENNIYIYNTGDKLIPFKKFSDFNLNEKLKEELLSNGRESKCHLMSCGLINYFENPATILTGTYERYKKKYLHSVIEIKEKDGSYIVDYTLNLYMQKEFYVELTRFKEIEAIKDIEWMEDNQNGILDFLGKIGSNTKPYLTFRQELKRGFERNNEMLTKTDNKELENRIAEMKKRREEIEER